MRDYQVINEKRGIIYTVFDAYQAMSKRTPEYYLVEFKDGSFDIWHEKAVKIATRPPKSTLDRSNPYEFLRFEQCIGKI